MSKLLCPCGHIISDTTDNLPFKGELTRDQDADALRDRPANELAKLFAALRSGVKETWIASHFGPEYPKDLDDESVISDFLAGLYLTYALCVYECLACGRLLVQRNPTDSSFVSFSPDSGCVEGLLAVDVSSRPVHGG